MRIRHKRHPNHRRVKVHRSYTVKETAQLLGIHQNTVLRWIKAGLQTIDTRPKLIQGRELRAFLETRRANKRCSCQPGQMYCFRCRASKSPAGGMVDHRRLTDQLVNAIGICPDCGCMMYQCVNISKLPRFSEKLDTTFPQALRHISEINQPSANSDFRGDV